MKEFSAVALVVILASLLIVIPAANSMLPESNIIRVPQDHSTIKQAVNASNPRDTIIVSEGTYAEGEIWIAKPNLTIIANGTVVVDGLRWGWVFYVIVDNITIRGFTIKKSRIGWPYAGICLDHVQGCTIENNTVKNSGDGILLFASRNNTVVGNNASFNAVHGISLDYSDHNIIANNTATNNEYDGIGLGSSDSNTLIGNTASENGPYASGIEIVSCVDTTLLRNTAIDNGYGGISLVDSASSTLRNNNMSANRHNFNHPGTGELSRFINDIDTSNLVDGKPIVYLVNQHNLLVDPTIFPQAGYVALVNSTGVTVKNMEVTSNRQGILFAFVTNSTIKDVTVSRCDKGIQIYRSRGNIAMENTVTDCWEGITIRISGNTTLRNNMLNRNGYGIYLDTNDCYVAYNMAANNTYGGILISGHSNTLLGNTIANTTKEDFLMGGIVLQGGGDNAIVGNIVTSNSIGIWAFMSDGNVVHHNNFVRNMFQVVQYPPTLVNAWDDGYPSGGNYWNDYDGTDLHSGLYQNETGSDGIGDTPYSVDANHVDGYPLIKMWNPLRGDVNWDGVVDIYDLVVAAACYGSRLNDLNWNPFVDVAPRWGIIDIYDVVTIASNYGKSA